MFFTFSGLILTYPTQDISFFLNVSRETLNKLSNTAIFAQACAKKGFFDSNWCVNDFGNQIM